MVYTHVLWMHSSKASKTIAIGGLYWAAIQLKEVHLVLVVDITMSMRLKETR